MSLLPMHELMLELRAQLSTRQDVHDFFRHGVNHMRIYTEIIGSRLLQITTISASYLKASENATARCVSEIGKLEEKMKRCEITPADLERLAMSGDTNHSVLEDYRNKNCYDNSKGFQLRKTFETALTRWWNEQRKLLQITVHDEIAKRDKHYAAEIASTELSQKQLWALQNNLFAEDSVLRTARTEADEAIEKLFRDHEPKYLSHQVQWEDEHYEKRLKEAANSLFLRADQHWFGVTVQTIKDALSSSWTGFRTQILQPLQRTYDQLDDRWKKTLQALAIVAILASVTAGALLTISGTSILSVGSVITTQYAYALALLQPYCFLLYDLETFVGLTYALRLFLGTKSSRVAKASQAVTDSVYPYCSPVLETVLTYVSNSDFFESMRSTIRVRFGVEEKEADKQIDSLRSALDLGTTTTDHLILSILTQCVYWSQYVLAFACVNNNFTIVQIAANKADQVNMAISMTKPYLYTIGEQIVSLKAKLVKPQPPKDKLQLKETEELLSSYVEQIMLLFRVQLI